MRDSGNEKEKFRTKGYLVRNDFLTPAECGLLASQLNQYREKESLARIYRKHRERSLDYFVIDGEAITTHLPDILKLYSEVNKIVNEVDSLTLTPLNDTRAAVNVNITPPNGEYRWHYDRNRVTALLYLNEVEGGEVQFYPRYRLLMPGRRHSRLQRWLDEIIQTRWIRELFKTPVSIAPKPGRLLIMRGDICLHSVCPVTGNESRINIVMAYDDPATDHHASKLDGYLYESESTYSEDPNYQR
jgi:hypothetical protein